MHKGCLDCNRQQLGQEVETKVYSFSLEGVRSEDFGIRVLDVRRNVLPSVQLRDITIPARAGSYFFGTDYQVQRIEVTFVVIEDDKITLQERMRDIAEYLDPLQGLLRLVFDDEPDRFYRAVIVEQTPTSQIRALREGELTFVATQPFAETVLSIERSLLFESANFARNSFAYQLNGERVGIHQPRFEDAMRNRQGLIMEENTTNRITNGDKTIGEAGVGGFTGANSDISIDSRYAWTGRFSIKCITKGALSFPSFEGWRDSEYYSAINSTQHCYSIYLRGWGDVRLRIWEYESASSASFIRTQNSVLIELNNDEWTRYDFVFTTHPNTNFIRHGVLTGSGRQIVTFWSDGMQLERKPYCTSFVLGGTARTFETLEVPLSLDGRGKIGTLEGYFSPVGELHPNSHFFDYGSSGNDRVRVRYFSLANTFSLYITNAGTGVTEFIDLILPSGTIRKGSFYYLVARYRVVGATNDLMAVDLYDFDTGQWHKVERSLTFVGAEMTGVESFSLGSASNGQLQTNSIISEFRASNIYRTNEELEEVVFAQRPFEVDERTDVKLSLNSHVGITDVSNIGTAPTPSVIRIIFLTPHTQTSFVLYHLDSARKVELIRQFSTDDLIVIDNQRNIIELYEGGVGDPINLMFWLSFDSEFFLLLQGDNRFDIDTDAEISTRISYKSRFL